jgi:two-component system, cell cycle sensor histidine kinase and response regulator CckA
MRLRDLIGRRRRSTYEVQLRLRDRAMQAISQGITIVDARAEDLPIVYASPSFEQLTGYSAAEIEGRNSRFLQGPGTDPASVAAIQAAIANGEECSIDILNYRKDGTPFWNAVTVSPVTDERGEITHYVGVQTDVTERRELEEHARTTRRLEALGQLAGGVAHDFNNLLTVIMGNAYLATQTASPDNRQELDDILIAASKATDLVRQLLAFSRQQPIEPSRVDLNEVIGDARKMLDRLIEATIEVRYDLSDDEVIVLADRGQIEQVVINLAVNARDAMPDGGRLTIRTALAGDTVTLAVEDTGAGMDPEVIDKIFLPFFTTKEVGKGTGLGLAAVYGIVDGAGGKIDVISALGEGSRFEVKLPLDVSEQTASSRSPAGASDEDALQGVTALLVEDNSTVRAIAEELLMAAGCELVLVADAERAIELTEDGEPYDVLITDVVMPRVTGPELARTIREHRPDVPVIFVSGYPQDKFAEAMSMARTAYVAKPFSLVTLQGAFADLVRVGQ